MPRFIPNMLFSDCWASVGQVSFYHRDGECFWRKKSHPQFPGTPLQLENQAVHSRALKAWKNLDPCVQESWNFYACDVPSRRPPHTTDNHITGHNLFVSAYHGFARLGCEQVPQPCQYDKFPILLCGFNSVEVERDVMRLRLNVSLKDCRNPQRYRLAVRLQLTRVGAGKRPGYMRSFVAESNLSSCDDVSEIRIPNYRHIWDIDSQEYQVNMRYFLLDTITGYRNMYKTILFSFSL